jgi:hypothetical protein
MKRLLGLIILTTASVFAIATQFTLAQPSTPAKGDPRVKAVLDQQGLKYEIDNNGDFKLEIQMEGNRTQLVWIESATEQVGGMEIRYMLSPAYKTKGTLSAEVANKLLADSASKKLGAWQVFKGNDSSVAIFCSKVAANSNPADLVASLQITLNSADEMEKTLSSKDDF